VVERGLGSSLPPVELARRDSGVFKELKYLFSTTLEVGEETEANGGHSGDWTLNRTQSWFDWTRPVSSTQPRLLGFATGASGQAPRGVARGVELIGRAARPVTRDRMRPVVEGAYWTLTGRWHCRVRSLRGARPVMSLRARCCVIDASGHFLERVRSWQRRVRSFPRARPVDWFDRWRRDRWRIGRGAARPVSSTGTSGHPEFCPVKG
jgi:hypothetical protein